MEIPQTLRDGMGRAETLRADGDSAGALAAYQALWDAALAANDDFQACVVAHFAAHAQITPEDQRAWHLRSLHAADAAAAQGDQRVRTFYPSLYGNLADVSLRLGDRTQARDYLDRTMQAVDVLADNAYWREVMQGLIAHVTAALGAD